MHAHGSTLQNAQHTSHILELTRWGFDPVAQKTGSFLLEEDFLASEEGNTAVRDF